MIEKIIIAGTILIVLVFLFLFFFYRDPERTAPKGRVIVSPADGKIIEIIKIDNKTQRIKKGVLGKIEAITKDTIEKGYLISIFMSPFDVHVNRAPIAGKVSYVKHTKGRFFNAANFEKSLMNEKNEIIIENNDMKIKVIQIAGFIARRIACYVKKGQTIKIGQKIGMIKLGSQLCIIMPDKAKINAKLKDRVKAGETIIATY